MSVTEMTDTVGHITYRRNRHFWSILRNLVHLTDLLFSTILQVFGQEN